MAQAQRLQALLAPANTAVTTLYSVAGLKAALEIVVGYGGPVRSPLQPLGAAERRRLAEILSAVTA
jgi:4-hydroxy-2-oxoglutarate aldolase